MCKFCQLFAQILTTVNEFLFNLYVTSILLIIKIIVYICLLCAYVSMCAFLWICLSVLCKDDANILYLIREMVIWSKPSPSQVVKGEDVLSRIHEEPTHHSETLPSMHLRKALRREHHSAESV